MSKRKVLSVGAKERWEKYLTDSGVSLTGVQMENANAIVQAIDKSGDEIFWNGSSTGKTFLFETLSKCFGG